MVNAGRILIIPKGNWDNLASYQMLDLITYDGIAYLAKQASTGINPKTDPNKDTYWQTFGTAVVPDGETIIYDTNNDIAVNIDGTTLQYDSGTNFVKVAIDGVTLKYDSTNGYIYANVSSSLAGLTDVQLTNIQNGQIIAYNSATGKFVNINLPTGGGSKIKVTTSETTLYGKTVTLSDGTHTLTGTFSNAGEYTFEGVEYTGNLTITSSDGTDTATRYLTVPYYSSYSVSLTFFEATVTVTYPENLGATCELSDGTTTIAATGSPMAFIVPNAGTWTATVTLDGADKTGSVTIGASGESKSITITYGTINLTYGDDFRGETITCVQGGTTISKTAPSAGNTMTFYPNNTGNWVISGTVGGDTYYSTPNPVVVSSLSTPVSAGIETVPNGKTVTPVNDVEIWLACAQISDVSYTTLAEVLADAETYERLLSDSNACDYMARSTTWASTICADADAMMRLGKYDYACDALLADSTWCTAICGSTYFEYVLDVSVPTMTSDTAPSGEAFSSTLEQSSAYYAFNTSTTGALTSRNATGLNYVGYKFTSAVKPSIVKITLVPQGGTSLTSVTFNIDKSADNSTWETVSTYVAEGVNSSSELNYIIPIDTVDSNMYYRVSSDTKWFNAGTINKGLRLQFYGRHTAQTDIIVTAHGGDTVYYLDNGSPVTLTTADSDTGIGTVDWSDLPKGAITLYSSTAKNPSDLTADYSKTVYVTEYTTQIYLMPETTIYWWGHYVEPMEAKPFAQGGFNTPSAPTITDNYTNVVVTEVAQQTRGTYGCPYPMPTASCDSLNIITSNFVAGHQTAKDANFGVSPTYATGFSYSAQRDAQNTSSTPVAYTLDISSISTDQYCMTSYLAFTTNESLTIYAFWLE